MDWICLIVRRFFRVIEPWSGGEKRGADAGYAMDVWHSSWQRAHGAKNGFA